MEETLGRLIGVLFMSRTASHMAHLKTGSYSQHKALNSFYEGIVDLADELAEVAQGRFGKLDIPFMPMKGDVEDPAGMLETHLVMIENLAKKCDVGALKNVVDEIQGLYLSTLYKMRELA